jgi:hypothetical protein
MLHLNNSGKIIICRMRKPHGINRGVLQVAGYLEEGNGDQTSSATGSIYHIATVLTLRQARNYNEI